SPSTMAALGTATGLNGALLGDLGLADIVVDGLRGLDDSSKVNLYGGTGPVRPAETATVQFDLDHVSLTQGQDRNPKISSGSLDGTVTFTPPAAGTYAPETATLVGVLKLKDAINAQVISYLVNVPGTVIPEPPDRDAIRPDASKRVRVSFQGALSADTVTNISHTPGTAPALVLVGTSDTGKLSGLTLKGQITASPTPTNLTSYSFDASVPSNANGLPAILFQRSYSLQGFNVPSYLTNALVAAPAATAAPSPGGGSKAGSAGGASSNGSSSFGSTVNFSLAYGLNGGANWTLTHFKGPSPSSPLFTGSRTETNTLNITFVPACRKTNPKEDIDLIAPKLSDFWSILSPCDADNVNVGNAAAAANQLNLLLRLH
ncbi:MAG: hypothetical protein OSB41_10590, partial [Kiritimatiellae bacterium]|nr:hypothetical protein [Kiritimatiellia bacterium]